MLRTEVAETRGCCGSTERCRVLLSARGGGAETSLSVVARRSAGSGGRVLSSSLLPITEIRWGTETRGLSQLQERCDLEGQVRPAGLVFDMCSRGIAQV